MTAAQKTKEDLTRRATLALRLLEGSIPEGAIGRIYRTETGWLLDYGQGAEVDLPDLSKEEIFVLINVDLRLPFAKLSGPGCCEKQEALFFPGLPPRKEI